jgi:ankyrin repeat protein
VKYLIEKGADANIEYREHKTPLMIAIEQSKMDIIKYLVENGADINYKN